MISKIIFRKYMDRKKKKNIKDVFNLQYYDIHII